MITKLITGGNFKGAAAYILHDVKASTTHRVDWTHTLNLATKKAQIAWRIMAATAMDADRLKAQAGVKSSGQKSSQDVLHLVLSWHPEERGEIDKDHMVDAVYAAMVAMGAENHQALIVAHNDTNAPHVHVLINRVNPNDGRKLRSSKNYWKLSDWALEYRKKMGKEHYCEERVHNANARRHRILTKHPEKKRHIFDAEQIVKNVANNNRQPIERLKQQISKMSKELAIEERNLQKRQKRDWDDANDYNKKRIKAIKDDLEAMLKKAINQLKHKAQHESRELTRIEAMERKRFNEKLRLQDQKMEELKAQMKEQENNDNRQNILNNNFDYIQKRAQQIEAFNMRYQQKRVDFDLRFKRRENALRRRYDQIKAKNISQHKINFQELREHLSKEHANERMIFKKKWRALSQYRTKAFQDMKKAYDKSGQAYKVFEAISIPDGLRRLSLKSLKDIISEQDNLADYQIKKKDKS